MITPQASERLVKPWHVEVQQLDCISFSCILSKSHSSGRSLVFEDRHRISIGLIILSWGFSWRFHFHFEVTTPDYEMPVENPLLQNQASRLPANSPQSIHFLRRNETCSLGFPWPFYPPEGLLRVAQKRPCGRVVAMQLERSLRFTVQRHTHLLLTHRWRTTPRSSDVWFSELVENRILPTHDKTTHLHCFYQLQVDFSSNA